MMVSNKKNKTSLSSSSSSCLFLSSSSSTSRWLVLSILLLVVLSCCPKKVSSFSTPSTTTTRSSSPLSYYSVRRHLKSIAPIYYHTTTNLKKKKVTNDRGGVNGAVNRPPSTCLFEQSEESSDEESSKSQKKIDGRKKRVILGYRITSIAYLINILRNFVSASGGGISSLSASSLLFSSGYVVLAGVTYILSGAAIHDRLNSDSYKRLNLGVLQYALLALGGLVLVLKKGVSFYAVPHLLAIINSIKGYSYGVLGWDKAGTGLVQDLVKKQMIGMTKGCFLTMPKTIKATGYLVATWMMIGLKFQKILEILDLLKSGGGSSSMILFGRIARLARFSLLAIVLFVLKDAADRDRLKGTTFIQLNGLSAIALGAMANYYGALSSPLGIAAGIFSVFCAINGIQSQIQKMKK